MAKGHIRVQATAGDQAIPIADADVVIKQRNSPTIYKTHTDSNGTTDDFPLPDYCNDGTQSDNYANPVYALCDVDVNAKGFVTRHIRGVEILYNQTAILPVHMEPLADEENPEQEDVTEIPPNGKLNPDDYIIKASSPVRSQNEVVIPDYITVHLGRPEDSSARNVRVAFVDYIKNVASSEIYATWPEQSLRANIHAIVSFALNRVYTEWYPNRGYNFDITNSTSYDQYFRYDGPIYESISHITDEIFNVYAHRFGFRNPYFTQFCDGRTVSCPGMSQWGTVTLANQGKNALEILRYYYPKDLMLTQTDNIAGIENSYPGTPLTVGSEGEDVRRIQNDLNRIRANYPLIPMITNPNGVFTPETQNAVTTFQRVFNLPADGIVNQATWNRISSIFTAVTRLAELGGEGIRYTVGLVPPNVTLSQGSRGHDVLEMQFIMNIVSAFFPSVPPVIMDGVFGESDRLAVIEFQKTFDIPQTGNVGPLTWEKLYSVYRGIRANVRIPG
ncbi:MAG: peptidoglycan-binding protein [Oscillospiraceae bacterium]|nr:peptidoglycan-binding protein [Oscillospiraceae bacterium]